MTKLRIWAARRDLAYFASREPAKVRVAARHLRKIRKQAATKQPGCIAMAANRYAALIFWATYAAAWLELAAWNFA